MADVAGDVPSKYDLVISDGTTTKGYVLYAPYSGGESSSVPEKAIHSYSPVFVPRTNIEGNFGDDSEDFFLTFSQNNWSFGEFQRHAINEDEGTGRYWKGSKVDVSVPGQVTISDDVKAFTPAAEIRAATGDLGNNLMFYSTNTNLYSISGAGTISNKGTHTAGTPTSMDADSINVYIAGGGSVRKWDTIAFSFATFSATDSSQDIVYLNNTLYGLDSSGVLRRYSTAGTATTVYTWRDSDGDVIEITGKLSPFGGKLLIMLAEDGGVPASLWIYDGVGVSKLADFPPSFFFRGDISVANGVVFVSGLLLKNVNTTTNSEPIVYYYANGTLGILWRAKELQAATVRCPSVAFLDGLVIANNIDDTILYYDPVTGGISRVSSFSGSEVDNLAASSSFLIAEYTGAASGIIWPAQDDKADSAIVISSLIDFDSHLTKLFRGIKIEYDKDTTGNGGSIDIAYRVGDVDGSYTTLQTDAVSGTEYTIGSVGTPITGRSISVKLTLNKGTSTLGPVLKRLYLRAAPKITQRHRGLYRLDCTGSLNGDRATKDHSGAVISRTGKAMVEELRTFSGSGNMLTITDQLHAYTGSVERLDIAQIYANEDPGYVVTLVAREV